ncbi:hypothetical protein [Streptomyces sp. NPDC046939]|uniref:tetratricopeptide repeat protein n=1 Tax=Streptomyces sp. NPDC046939 TaxID=3155376 RepID=UPI0033FCCF79
MELQALHRRATGNGKSGSTERLGPGRLIDQWEPHDLEVHPAGIPEHADTLPRPGERVLSGYVRRGHDRALGNAVQDVMVGRSRMVVLVGSSSTGKTRACWESVQPLADQAWRLWHPDPTQTEAMLQDLRRVQPRTVIWLNEAQHYLRDERVAQAVRDLLTDPERGPVLVLATLWPEHAHQYMTIPAPGQEDPHHRARALLAGRTVTVPEVFDARALAAAATLALAGDRLLADALTRARTHGRLAQDLAGAPELLTRYQQATPAAKALLDAAMDARRLGVGPHLPHAFLADAASDYLDQTDYDQLTNDWAEKAFTELAAPVHGKQAPLSPTTPRPRRRPPAPTPAAPPPSSPPTGQIYRLADYLEQHGTTTRARLCPPISFWHAAHTHLTHPDDLDNLVRAAETRHRLQWAHHLRHRAAAQGSTTALRVTALAQEKAGDREGAERLAWQAIEHNSAHALAALAEWREEAGDRESAETLAQQAADHGYTDVLRALARIRKEMEDQNSALALYRQAADLGDIKAVVQLVWMHEEAGDLEGAETLARLAAQHGNAQGLNDLSWMREESGDRDGAESLAWQAAHHGDTVALARLALQRDEDNRDCEVRGGGH